MNLKKLGIKHGTDKQRHKFADVGYMTIYQHYFGERKYTVRNILELGVLDGRSLKVWRDFFPNAQVWGVDINPDSFRDYGERIHVMIGFQTDPTVLASCAAGQVLDIVIDDGSHVVDHMLESFRLLWHRISSRGLYVIEDLANAYYDISGSHGLWPGQLLNPLGTTNYNNDSAKLNKLLNDMTENLDKGKGDMLCLHRWHQLAILCKK